LPPDPHGSHPDCGTPFYNVGVAEPQPTRSITRTETLGLLVLAVVILVVILARWGSVIPWSAR
jgi:hypothetical protein